MLCPILNTRDCIQIKNQLLIPLEYTKKLLKEAKIDVGEIAINGIPGVPIWDSKPVTVDFTCHIRIWQVVSENIVAQLTTWWALKDISGMPLLRGNRQLVSSLTWRRPMRQPGNMALSETFTGLASEADCLFLCQNISETVESESELGQHSLTNSTRRKVFQLAVS